jgi:hypothetical protein
MLEMFDKKYITSPVTIVLESNTYETLAPLKSTVSTVKLLTPYALKLGLVL